MKKNYIVLDRIILREHPLRAGKVFSCSWGRYSGSLIFMVLFLIVFFAAFMFPVSAEMDSRDVLNNTQNHSGSPLLTSPAPVAEFSGEPTVGAVPLQVQFTDQSMGNPTGWAWYFGDEDFNNTWLQVSTSPGWEERLDHSCVVQPDGAIVLIGGSLGPGHARDVWRSTTQGATWTEMTSDIGWGERRSFASVALPDGSIVLMGGYRIRLIGQGYRNDVWRSTDNGATWTQLTSDAGWSERGSLGAVVLSDGSIVLMGGIDDDGNRLNDVWRSTDNGATWTRMTANAPWEKRNRPMCVVLPGDSIVLMGGIDEDFGNMSDVWLSTDNGANWKEVTSNAPSIGRFNFSSVATPDGSIVVMGGGHIYRNDVWRSRNKGKSWTLVTNNAAWVGRYGHATVVMPNGNIVLMGGFNYDEGGRRNDVWRLITAGSNLQNRLHTYQEPGTYDVTLQSFNSHGSSNIKKEKYITVEPPPPTADFTGEPTTGPVPLTVDFTDLSTGFPSGWSWYFGDEDFSGSWSQSTASASWGARTSHSSVSLRDGSIVLMGGNELTGNRNDVWRSTNQGASWTQMTANSGWSAREGHTSVALPDGAMVVMGGRDSSENLLNDVWHSEDKGATWTQMTSTAGWSKRMNHTSVSSQDGSIFLMGGYDDNEEFKNDVWRSTDKGETWTRMTANAGWSGRWNHAGVALPDGSIAIMGGWDGSSRLNDVWRSTNNGVSWNRRTGDAAWTGRWGLEGAALPDNSIIVMGGFDGANKNDVWRSTDTGISWTQLTANAGWGVRSRFGSAVLRDGSIVIMGGYTGTTRLNNVWRLVTADSTAQNPSYTYNEPGTYQVSLHVFNDFGCSSMQKIDYITVTVTPPLADFSGNPTSGTEPLQVQFSDQSTGYPESWVWYFGEENYDGNWTQMTVGAGWSARHSHSSVVLPDGDIVLLGGWDYTRKNDIWRSKNKGAAWTQVTTTGDMWSGRSALNSVALTDGSIVVMGGYDGSSWLNDVWRSTDKGATWTRMTANAGWSGRHGHSSVVLSDGSIVLMGGYDGSARVNDVWRSTDKGATWTRMTANAGWSGRFGHSSVALPNGNIVLMGGFDGSENNDVWRSTDNGANWTRYLIMGGIWSARRNHSTVVQPDGSIILMGGHDGTSRSNDIWRSTNNGLSWVQVNVGAQWTERDNHSSVVLPDGSIVLMGGFDGSFKNDVWRLTTSSSTEQHPVYTYTVPGTYTIALQVYNEKGWSSVRKTDYITVEELVLPDYDSEVVGWDLPDRLPVNRAYTMILTLCNTGANPWKTVEGINLGAVGDHDDLALPQYWRVPQHPDVYSMETYTYEIELYPQEMGIFTTQWQMVHEGEFWFGEIFSREVEVYQRTDIEGTFWHLFE